MAHHHSRTSAVTTLVSTRRSEGELPIGIWRYVKIGAVAVLAAGALASCTLFSRSPEQVQSTNPTVTYNYRTDQELLQVNQRATTYCSQYQTTPRTANITTNSDGSKTVQFECVRTTSQAPASTTPSQSYSYRTDQELIQASQNADAYCQRSGSKSTMSNISTNPDGTKTATFQCGPR
jgi:hypothetical protein